MSICFDPPRRQRGDMMLEALVGVLITSIIGAGLAHVVANVMNSQRDAKVENLMVERLRDSLHGQGVGLCGSATLEISLPNGEARNAAVSCEPATATLAMAGVERTVEAPQRVDLTVTASDLGNKGAGEDDPDLLVSTRQ
ncbi:MAG: type IV pilus modification PilV family protein [Stenotrophomonas sp.]|uniref:type IV pilus modification PilV family protein n=1 Tax=Stenotrophomonas sp. TaxID=69392 RepID=UPI0028A7B620|nr:hypothetical protein [Stenotrophomonas sp.]